MEIVQQNDVKKGAFLAKDGDKTAGEMSYTWAGPDKFIIDHTEVDEAYGGKGIGKQLVMKAVEFAREQNVKIMPLCPFARKVFSVTPEIQDVQF
jgi:uncharacterized protein